MSMDTSEYSGTLTLDFNPASWPRRIHDAIRPPRWSCEYCRTSNKDEHTFCEHCGAPRREPEPEKLPTRFEEICKPAADETEEPSRWQFLRRLLRR